MCDACTRGQPGGRRIRAQFLSLDEALKREQEAQAQLAAAEQERLARKAAQEQALAARKVAREQKQERAARIKAAKVRWASRQIVSCLEPISRGSLEGKCSVQCALAAMAHG